MTPPAENSSDSQMPRPKDGVPTLPPPSGMVWFGDVRVAGTSYEGRKDILRLLARKGNQDSSWVLIPEREPANPHDENAIAVVATKGKERLHLGYLPKQVAAHVGKYQRIGLVPRSIAEDGRYLYVDVYHSKKARKGCLGCVPLLILLATLSLAILGLANQIFA